MSKECGAFSISEIRLPQALVLISKGSLTLSDWSILCSSVIIIIVHSQECCIVTDLIFHIYYYNCDYLPDSAHHRVLNSPQSVYVLTYFSTLFAHHRVYMYNFNP